MTRTMAAVIVGPTIRPSVSVFASEFARSGATESWLATYTLKAHRLRVVEAERGYLDVKRSDAKESGGHVYVVPETGLPLQPEFRRDRQS